MHGFRFRLKTILIAGAVLGALGIAAVSGAGGVAQNLPRDCDATSIIYCGSLTLDELKSDYNSNDSGRYPDIPAVFNHFGISSADVNGMNSSNHKRGIVKADNTVWLDGKQIGFNAVTAGRVNKPGSTAIPGTNAYKRPPSVSFANANTQIDAFIGFENGEPAWAILSSCGNPVVWEKPKVDKPDIVIEKTIRTHDDKSWVENDSFDNNSMLTYRINVKNNGKAADTNVVVSDVLPEQNTFVAGSVMVNGQSAGAAGDNLVTQGHMLGTLQAGAGAEITFKAKASVGDDKCGETPFVNKARVKGDKTASKEDTAGGKVKVVCAIVKCVSLTASVLSVEQGETIEFTAQSQVENATLQSYEFKVNDQVVQDTNDNTYTYNADEEGEFTVMVTVKTDKGNDTNENCVTKIVISEKPVCPYNPSLPPEHPECKKPQVQGTSTLPKTGAGGVMGIVAATSLSGTALHYFYNRRRQE